MLEEQTKLIIQTLESAEKSLALAKKLLGGEGLSSPGVVGKFDGESIVTEKGQKHYVPPNYSSKSRLVVGDTLRMIGQGEKALFKQIEKKERIKVSGVLTKKDGQWAAVAEEGSFFVLPVSVKYFKGEIGDEVEVIIPKDYKTAKPKWAALEQVVKPAATEAQKGVEALKRESPMQPKEPRSLKQPKTPQITKKPVITETPKKPEVQKKATPKQLKSLKRPNLKGEQSRPSSSTPTSPRGGGQAETVRGEIKVEEELR